MRIVQVYRNAQLIPSEKSRNNGNVGITVIKMQGNLLPMFWTDFEANQSLIVTDFELFYINENELYKNNIVIQKTLPLSSSNIKSEVVNNKIRFYFDLPTKISHVSIYQLKITLSDGTFYKTALFYADPIRASFACSGVDFNQTTDIFSFSLDRTDDFSPILNYPFGVVVTAFNGEAIVTTERFTGSLAPLSSFPINFDISGKLVTKISWDGDCEGFVLFANYKQSNSVSIGSNFELKFYDDSITINAITSNSGTATLQIVENKIVTLTQGTLYDLKFTDSLATNYRVIFSENGIQTVHCVITSELLLVTGMAQIKQDDLAYNNSKGITILTDNNTGFKIYVPYTEKKVKIYI